MAGVKSCPRRNAGVPALLLSVLSVSCVVSPVSGSSTAVCSSMFVGGDCVNTRSSCTADASVSRCRICMHAQLDRYFMYAVDVVE